MHATAVNPLDYQIRRGDYADYVPLPAIIGHDISGVIEEVGSLRRSRLLRRAARRRRRPRRPQAGDAEQHVADVDLVGRKPENLSHLEAA
ncbi:alcohol dehydrogenase catalytic domain-containing protein, partial [Mycolicibacterium sphagni]|uniref:alcohol dehydrogenase catalytic domain-containing protein n=1 Tax=Mycolicibacterium sphagni TaxID=1786 RepID=UPI0021F380EF